MKGKVKFVSEVDNRLIIETDQTFDAYDKEGVKGQSNQFSIGLKSAILALSDSPIGAIIAAKCGGRPQQYEGVANVLVFALFGAEIEFDRKELAKGDKRMDGTPCEKPCFQTQLKKVVSHADMALLMTLTQSITKKVVTATAVNPFV